jgi:YVTN family beta-propeller protein
VTNNIEVGLLPLGVAVAPAGDFVYVTNSGSEAESLSVIRTDTESVVETAPLPSGSSPTGIAVASDGRTAYVGLRSAASVAVVDTEKARTDPANAVITSVTVGNRPQVVVVTDLP